MSSINPNKSSGISEDRLRPATPTKGGSSLTPPDPILFQAIIREMPVPKPEDISPSPFLPRCTPVVLPPPKDVLDPVTPQPKALASTPSNENSQVQQPISNNSQNAHPEQSFTEEEEALLKMSNYGFTVDEVDEILKLNAQGYDAKQIEEMRHKKVVSIEDLFDQFGLTPDEVAQMKDLKAQGYDAKQIKQMRLKNKDQIKNNQIKEKPKKWTDTRKVYALPLIGLAIIGAGLFAGVHWGHVSLDTTVAVGSIGLLTTAGLAAFLFIKSKNEKKKDWMALIGLVPLVAAVASYFIINHFGNVNPLDMANGGFHPASIGNWVALTVGGAFTFATTVALAALYNGRRKKEQAEADKLKKDGGAAPGNKDAKEIHEDASKPTPADSGRGGQGPDQSKSGANGPKPMY